VLAVLAVAAMVVALVETQLLEQQILVVAVAVVRKILLGLLVVLVSLFFDTQTLTQLLWALGLLAQHQQQALIR
jgi:hypothetical protein